MIGEQCFPPEVSLKEEVVLKDELVEEVLVTKWKRQLLFCQRRAEVATGQWPRSCRWHNNHYMPEEVEFLPSPPSSPMRPVEEDNPPTSREELPPPHLPSGEDSLGLLLLQCPPSPTPSGQLNNQLPSRPRGLKQGLAGEVHLHLLPPAQVIKLDRYQAGEQLSASLDFSVKSVAGA